MKRIDRLTAAALLIAVLGLGVYGMRRSLWLDEAWVANSIRTRSLGEMFYYPGWLQLNPPLFLLLARAAVSVAGASNAAFRAVPLVFAVAATAGMLAVSRRVLSAPLAALATAIVVFNPVAIEYSRTLKPYSGELAASTALLLAAVSYLKLPDKNRFPWLLAITIVAMTLAYPAVFILPGIVAAVAAMGSLRRGLLLGGLAGSLLLIMYLLTIRPNLAPELREFWAADADHGMTAGLLIALLICVGVATRAAFAITRREPSPRDWCYIICVLPCLLLAVSGAFGWYPVSHRTRLFALPCFVLLLMMTAEDEFRRFGIHKIAGIVAAALTAGIVCFAVTNQIVQGRDAAEEDFAGALSFLESHVQPSDLVLVHACCKEGFELYSSMDDWRPAHVLYGDTGWPCCARGKDARPGVSMEQAVFADLDGKIPHGFSGRVWLLFTTRPTHWNYIGLNEGELWRKHLWDRGCPPGPYLRFANLAISPMDCIDAR